MPSTSIQDTPQAVTVISGELMKAQATTTLGDALRNSPGITIAIGEGGTLAGDQFKIRGFDAKDDVYLDGLRDFGAYTRDSFDFEEVQVLKGPSGLMFGRGTTGGAINTVSKTAHLGDSYLGHIEGGNGAHVRATADVNYQLSDTAAVRLNLMFTDTGTVDRDLVHSTRWGIAPTVSLGLGTDTVFTASYIHQQTSARPDYGLVVASPPNSVYAAPVSEFGVPRNTYMGFFEDHDKNTADLFTTKITHVATDWLTLENDTRAALYSRDFRYTSSDACDNTIAVGTTTGTNYCNLRIFGIAQPGAAAGSFNPTGTLVRTGGGGPYHQNSWGVQDTGIASANFHVGGLRNTFIAGFDASYQRADRTIYAYNLPQPGDLHLCAEPAGQQRAVARQYRLPPVRLQSHLAGRLHRGPADCGQFRTFGRQPRRHQRDRHHRRQFDRRRHRPGAVRHRPVVVHRRTVRDCRCAHGHLSGELQHRAGERHRQHLQGAVLAVLAPRQPGV